MKALSRTLLVRRERKERKRERVDAWKQEDDQALSVSLSLCLSHSLPGSFFPQLYLHPQLASLTFCVPVFFSAYLFLCLRLSFSSSRPFCKRRGRDKLKREVVLSTTHNPPSVFLSVKSAPRERRLQEASGRAYSRRVFRRASANSLRPFPVAGCTSSAASLVEGRKTSPQREMHARTSMSITHLCVCTLTAECPIQPYPHDDHLLSGRRLLPSLSLSLSFFREMSG